MSRLLPTSWPSESCVGWEVWGGAELDKEGWTSEDWASKKAGTAEIQAHSGNSNKPQGSRVRILV